MMPHERIPNYTVVSENDTEMVIMDVGPWDVFPTITNNVEAVVNDLAGRLGDRKLLYYDSEGDLDEILVKNERFAGFAPGPLRRYEP